MWLVTEEGRFINMEAYTEIVVSDDGTDLVATDDMDMVKDITIFHSPKPERVLQIRQYLIGILSRRGLDLSDGNTLIDIPEVLIVDDPDT